MNRYPRRMFAVPARWARKVSFAQRRTVARFAVVAACAMFLAVAATSAIAVHWARDMREPRIALLGAGNHLSVLVTAGDARVLIVSGNEPAAFADALSRALPPTMRRLDVLIVGGNADGLNAPNDDLLSNSRAMVSLVGSSTASEANTAMAVEPAVMRTPRRIRLTRDVVITLETAPTGVATTDDAEAVWRATIVRGGTRVVILSDGNAAERFEQDAPVSAMVVAGGRPELAVRIVDAPLVAFSAEALSGKELRQQPRPNPDRAAWAVRVFPGEAVRLDLTDAGLQFDQRDAQQLPSRTGAATPVAEP